LQEYSTGICVFSAKAKLVTAKFAGPTIDDEAVAMVAEVLGGGLGGEFTLAPPQPGSVTSSSARVTNGSLMGACIPAQQP
jgi:hypothetical protein